MAALAPSVSETGKYLLSSKPPHHRKRRPVLFLCYFNVNVIYALGIGTRLELLIPPVHKSHMVSIDDADCYDSKPNLHMHLLLLVL